jgi:plastocyanin
MTHISDLAGNRAIYALFAALLSVTLALPAWAVDTVVLTLKDHKFTPDKVTVPAGQRFRIEVINNDDTVEEFESHDLKIEKIVVPGGKISVNAGPLKPGVYKFFGEYHPDQATGTITAVAP